MAAGKMINKLTGRVDRSLLDFGVVDVPLFSQPLGQLSRDDAGGLHRLFPANHFPRHEVAEEFAEAFRGLLRPERAAIGAAVLGNQVVFSVVTGPVTFQLSKYEL